VTPAVAASHDVVSLYRQSLALKEKLLGPAHPDVAVTANNLAVLYKTQQRYSEAERCYRRALAIFERSLGPSHPRTIACREHHAGAVRAAQTEVASDLLREERRA